MKNSVIHLVWICPLSSGPLSEESKNNFPLHVDIKATDQEADDQFISPPAHVNVAEYPAGKASIDSNEFRETEVLVCLHC